MTLEVGKVYITRDGRKARIICTDKIGNNFVIIGLVELIKGNEEAIRTWTKDGTFFKSKAEHDLDLVEEYSFWNDVEIDTKIQVKDCDGTWVNRHFARKYNIVKIYSEPKHEDGLRSDLRYWLKEEFFTECSELLFDREAIIQEMTVTEIEEALGKKIKIISKEAR